MLKTKKTDFKQGDKIVIVSTPSNKNWVKEMDKYCGQTLTIDHAGTEGGKFACDVQENEWSWTDSHNHIDWDATFKLANKDFKKSDLQSGDKVVYRKGEERFVLLETDSLHGSNGEMYSRLSKYTDNLMYLNSSYSKLDIMKVYRDGQLIWEREELTKAEKEVKRLEARLAEIMSELDRAVEKAKKCAY